MAICFELVVNFSEDIEAAQAAALASPSPLTLQAGSHRIPLHRAMINRSGSYIELSVLPVSVGWGVGIDGTLPRTRLSAAGLSELGHGLYRLLAKLVMGAGAADVETVVVGGEIVKSGGALVGPVAARARELMQQSRANLRARAQEAP